VKVLFAGGLRGREKERDETMAKTKDSRTDDCAVQAPQARKFLALLQGIEEADDAEAEWRRLEQEWLAAVLHQPVIAFDDVQIAAELMARHRWEDAGSGNPRGRAAFMRLRQLRKRRAVTDGIS
jgi:hypothetical protein